MLMTISDLARAKGVDQALISRRVKKLGIAKIAGPSGAKFVDVAEYDDAVGKNQDNLERARLGSCRSQASVDMVCREIPSVIESIGPAIFDMVLAKVRERLGYVPVSVLEQATARLGDPR